MAYNPFNIFRRNQRALFAVITVFIMFTFVLSSGLGGGADFFDWLPSWLGKNKKGDHVCTIDGTKVYERDLQNLRRQRVIANQFMALAAAEAEDNINSTLSEKAKDITPQFRSMLQLIMRDPQQSERFIQMLLDDTPGQPKPFGLSLSASEKDLLRAIQALNAINQMRQVTMMQGRHFFVNAPNRSNRDLIDFMLWEKKADQMKVRFTEDDIKALIRKEFFGQFKNDVLVRKQMEKDVQGFSLDACIKAIGDEFRVREVQTAFLGPSTVISRDDSTLTASPLFTPPYELYDFYRDRVSPTTYSVIAVPGLSFADKVTGTPPDSELQALYQKYGDQEFDPSKEEPGFRQPRKIRVEWIKVTGSEPYYQKKAQEWVIEAEKYRRMEVGALAIPLPGVGPGFVGLATAPMVATDPLIWDAYQAIDYYHRGSIRIDWESSQYVLRPLDTSVVRPQNIVAAAGGAAGGLLAFGGPFQPLAATYGGAMFFEQGDRVKAGMPIFFALPGPGLQSTLLGASVGTKIGAPRPISIDTYRPELMKKVTDKKANDLALADLRKLQTDLGAISKDTKLGASERLGKARETIAAFIKERGLATGATTDYRDEWTIEDDAGMAPLKSAAKTGSINPFTGSSKPTQFGKKFFWTEDFSKLRGNPRMMEILQSGNLPMTPATGKYLPDFYPQDPGHLSENDPAFMFWRTDEVDSKKLTFDQAKNTGALLAAWKRSKGREMAKARADDIAKRLQGRSASGPQLVQNIADEGKVLQDEFRGNDKAVDRVKQFDIDSVAPLAPGMNMTQFGGGEKTVRPFHLDASPNIPYPTPEMEKALLDERTKPVGTSFVLVDKPRDVFYVVTLTKRQVLTPKDFGYEVFSPLAREGGVGGGVRRAFLTDYRKRAVDTILDIIKKEFEYVETEDQTKKLDANKEKDKDEEP